MYEPKSQLVHVEHQIRSLRVGVRYTSRGGGKATGAAGAPAAEAGACGAVYCRSRPGDPAQGGRGGAGSRSATARRSTDSHTAARRNGRGGRKAECLCRCAAAVAAIGAADRSDRRPAVQRPVAAGAAVIASRALYGWHSARRRPYVSANTLAIQKVSSEEAFVCIVRRTYGVLRHWQCGSVRHGLSTVADLSLDMTWQGIPHDSILWCG